MTSMSATSLMLSNYMHSDTIRDSHKAQVDELLDASLGRSKMCHTPAVSGANAVSVPWTGLSGRHLDHRKEIDLSRRAPRRNCPGSRSGRSEAIFPHPLEMHFDCLLDVSQRYINGLLCCHAPQQIGHRGSPVTVRVFIDADQILNSSHGFSLLSLACRFTEASVPFGMSRMFQISLR